ncbi:MAG TPA: potassium transporter Kup [Thermoanaerobaculia bacterium]|jgi:KUP system potassium uptake protein|nr:potassium transporter Kup [Thermoanaerobaculia bacterium]
MTHPAASPHTGKRELLGLSLGALGIVYGDIGTSPLYSLRECFHGEHGVPPSHGNVLGVLSLVFWVLIVTISIKYLVFVMRADNRGEGGILALLALVPRKLRRAGPEGRWILVALGIFGAALLYGDGMITPAISVLSAVEGLSVATPFFNPYVVPITLVILFILFLIQRRGTGGIGALFGPVMILWFAVLAVLGVIWTARVPSVLAAINPWHAVRFFVYNRWQGFLVLGSVFLVVTGGEALYADMGHFGRRPIRIAWFTLVLPALLLNYFGQGALLLNHPDAAQNPFFELSGRLGPAWILYPMVVLSTVATIIASQAVISGAFSLTRQAVQLGYMPRIKIVHTSLKEIGQIYIPSINWLLMFATFGLVLGFRESTRLAAAYGVAVTATMVITTILAYVVARQVWGWPRWAVAPVTAFFLLVDVSFFGANIIKVEDGGWFPLLVGIGVYTLMSTWKKGRQILATRLQEDCLPLESFIAQVRPDSPARVPGTAIFLARDPNGTPPSLLHNLKHNKVLHSKVVVLTLITEEVPTIPGTETIEIQPLGKEFYRVLARHGFMQTPEVPEVLAQLREKGLDLNLMSTTFFLSRETLIPSKAPGMAIWREKLFATMVRNAQRPTEFFQIPVNRVVELGLQVRL